MLVITINNSFVFVLITSMLITINNIFVFLYLPDDGPQGLKHVVV
jgi:hypothetical protein